MRIAGASTSPSGSAPKRSLNFDHAATAPGIVTEWMPVCGMRGDAAGAQPVDGQRRRRAAAAVDAVQLAGRGVVDDREEIAADAVHHRRHHAHRGVDGDRRVHRVTAARQHRRAGLRGERMLAGDDAAGGHDHRSPLRAVDGRTDVVGRRFRNHRGDIAIGLHVNPPYLRFPRTWHPRTSHRAELAPQRSEPDRSPAAARGDASRSRRRTRSGTASARRTDGRRTSPTAEASPASDPVSRVPPGAARRARDRRPAS